MIYAVAVSSCASCGFDSPPGFAFCGQCGAAVGSVPVVVPPAAARSERRQLTVLFCDVVDSAVLAGRLDPEDLREVLRAYHDVAGAAIGRFGGHTAQVLGDGVLVYFGYPVAHEDDARRAVHTALQLLAEVKTLGERLLSDQGLRFAVRVGIHTGPVVAGNVSVGASHENLAVGQTPNIAARLQGLAEAGTILLSGTTHRLVHRFFECEPLGLRPLKGIEADVDVYRVLRESGIVDPFEMVARGSLAPIVGRVGERTLLVDRFDAARGGAGGAVLVLGEAGVGKSRLLQQFREDVAEHAPRLLSCAGSPFHEGSPLHPVAGLVERFFDCGSGPAETRVARLRAAVRNWKLPEDEAVPLFARLVSLPAGSYEESALAPARQRERTLELLVSMFTQIARDEPLVLVIEDLHFVDPSTLQFIDALLKDIDTTRLLLLLTARPAFGTTWPVHAHLESLSLGRLGDDDVAALIAGVAGAHALPPALMRRLAEKADGVPLFIEELTKAVLEADAGGAVAVLDVPSTLRDSLTSRLDRLGPARRVAEVASVLGREFGYELLRAVYDGEEAALQAGLVRLEQAELVFAHGILPNTMYLFKHALVQDAAYSLLLKSARRDYHQRTAEALLAEPAFDAASQPELVAHHYSEAGMAGPAIAQWLRAADRAWERSANAEGLQSLERALSLVGHLPVGERDRQEIAVRTNMGRVLTALRGYADPAVGEVYERALELSEKVGDSDQRFWALNGLHTFHTVRGHLLLAGDLSRRLLQRAEATGDASLLVEAHYKLASNYFFRGEFVPARVHFELAWEVASQRGTRRTPGPETENPDVHSLAFLAATLWHLGYPDQARHRADEAIALARELSHPYSVAAALTLFALFPGLSRGDHAALGAALGEAMPLCQQHGFMWWLAMAAIVHGYVMVAGDPEGDAGAQGAGMMRHTEAALAGAGSAVGRPMLLGLVAQAELMRGDRDAAVAAIDEGLAVASSTTQGLWSAELHRLRGEAARLVGAGEEAEGSFRRALDTARAQQSRALELRAATSLARLLADTARRIEARDVLAPVHVWFTEGHDTADLQAAARVLAGLA